MTGLLSRVRLGILCVALILGGGCAGTNGGNNSFTPTRYWLGFETYDASGPLSIHLARSDGTNSQPIAGLPAQCLRPAFSPDGSKMAYCAPINNTTVGIYIIDLVSHSPTLIKSLDWEANNFIGVTTLRWSPTGNKLLFMNRFAKLVVCNTDGSNEVQVTPVDPAIEDLEGAFSPDGTRVVARRRNIPGSTDGVLWTMALDGSQQTQLTPNEDTFYFPDWSPDGTKIACLRAAAGQLSGLTILSSTTGQIQRLIVPPGQMSCEGYPRWSPDGSMLAFPADQGDPHFSEVGIIEVATGKAFSFGANIGQVVWLNQP